MLVIPHINARRRPASVSSSAQCAENRLAPRFALDDFSVCTAWRKAGALGLLSTDVPEQYGGSGGDFRTEAIVAEELGS